jgi:hypothetical protein
VESGVLDLRLDQKTDLRQRVLAPCMHYGEAQGDTMEALVHRAVPPAATQDECRSQDFGRQSCSTYGIGLGVFYSVPEWNADALICAMTRFVIAVARLFQRGNSDLQQVGAQRNSPGG